MGKTIINGCSPYKTINQLNFTPTNQVDGLLTPTTNETLNHLLTTCTNCIIGQRQRGHLVVPFLVRKGHHRSSARRSLELRCKVGDP